MGSTREDVEVAEQAATRTGELLVQLRARAGEAGPGLARRGDELAGRAAVEYLRDARPHDPILIEDAPDDLARLASPRCWIVDPLDGSREYGLPPRTDWAVHVGLWRRGEGIVAAAVALPALHRVHTTAAPLAAPPCSASSEVLLVSATRPPLFVDRLARRLRLRVTPMGSAGAKAMTVVSGDAVAYVHAGGQWEWDSAAPVGIALAAGLHASRLDGAPLVYNQPRPFVEDLVICAAERAEEILAAIAQARSESGQTPTTIVVNP